jgi:putative two-component system response regulator
VTLPREHDPAGDRRVLVVDDEPTIRDPLGRYLASRGYEVHTADSVTTAVTMVDRMQFGAMLCDVRMPGRSGLELLPEVLARDPDCAVVMLTGMNDAATATEALALGAVDYLTKPVELDRLAIAIGTALDRRRARMEERDIEQLVREEVALRTAALEREKLALRAHAIEVLSTLVTLTEAKIPFHAGHARRSAKLGAQLAVELALDADTVELIEIAGMVHDIGKIAIPDALLVKLEPLTAEEWLVVREHVRIGVDLLRPLRHLSPMLPFVRDHHECWDGSGYPEGSRGEEISIGGRILMVADAFTASVAGRAYDEPQSAAAALARLEQFAGTRFDPVVVRALRALVERQAI